MKGVSIVISIIEKLKQLQKRIKYALRNDLITVYAAQASFYIVIASLPFTMLLLSLMQLLLLNRATDLIVSVKPFLSSGLYNIVERMLALFHERADGIIPISSVTAVWTASRGIAAISRGVRRVYKIKPPGFWNTLLKDSLNTLLLIPIILLSLIALAFGSALAKLAAIFFSISSGTVTLFILLRVIVFMLILTLLFAFVYRMISSKSLPFKTHIPGAAFSAFGWVIFSLLYEFYIENFANYSYLYGSLTAIVLLMLWLYFCMIIFLFGAEFNMILHERKEKQ